MLNSVKRKIETFRRKFQPQSRSKDFFSASGADTNELLNSAFEIV
jgi:hypothetical protein